MKQGDPVVIRIADNSIRRGTVMQLFAQEDHADDPQLELGRELVKCAQVAMEQMSYDRPVPEGHGFFFPARMLIAIEKTDDLTVGSQVVIIKHPNLGRHGIVYASHKEGGYQMLLDDGRTAIESADRFETLNPYAVHIYSVVRTKVADVWAQTPEDAIRLATDRVNLSDIVKPPTEDAEEIVSYLVDHGRDEEHENTTGYCVDGVTPEYTAGDNGVVRRCSVCLGERLL